MVNPLSVSVKLFVAEDEMLPLRSCGANPGTVRVRTVGDGGVILKPFCSEKEGVITITPAVVPLCRGTVVAFPLNNACVVFAGIVKFTKSPPLANRIEESPAKTFEVKASVNVP